MHDITFIIMFIIIASPFWLRIFLEYMENSRRHMMREKEFVYNIFRDIAGKISEIVERESEKSYRDSVANGENSVPSMISEVLQHYSCASYDDDNSAKVGSSSVAIGTPKNYSEGRENKENTIASAGSVKVIPRSAEVQQ